MVYNPEFLTVISDTLTKHKKFCIDSSNEGRIVLGEGKNKKAGNIVEELYIEFNPGVPILKTDYKTAEMLQIID